ncbi:hypothetical protein [Rothia nasimurium]|uniref:hypothetical protein n=1 Tax=Rothia nasimurium TaxID=85336 RepID=UPI001F340624|nr:hypothetical protein [Rothia nasimurium]
MLVKDALKEIQGSTRLPRVSRWALFIFGVPLAASLLILFFNVSITAPAAILTMVALLFSGYLSGFVHYSTIRQKLTEQEEEYTYSRAPERRFVDHTATLLLFGACCSAASAAVLACIIAVTPANTALCPIASAAVAATALTPITLFAKVATLLSQVYKQVVSKPQTPKTY